MQPRIIVALVFFRFFGLDPHIPGRPLISILLVLHAIAVAAAPIVLLIYAFFVMHMFSGSSMLTLLSAMFIGCMFSTQSLVVVNALMNRRGLMVVRRHLSRVDRCLAEAFRLCNCNADSGVTGDIALPQTLRLLGMLVAIVIVFVLYLYRIHGGDLAAYLILSSMATIKMCNLQSIFYVDQIAVRLARIRRTLNSANSRSEHSANVLECAKQAHHELWLAADELNGAQSMAWFVIALQTLEELVVNVYLISSALFTGAVPIRAINLPMFGVVPTVLTFVMVCWSCDRCAGAAQNVGEQLARLECHSMDDESNDVQQEFSLQLQLMPIGFSAGGFFDIDMQLLTSMFAVLLANIIVLIQFQDAELESNTKLYNGNPVKAASIEQ